MTTTLTIIKKWWFVFLAATYLLLMQSATISFAQEKPFIDENGNGINDLDEHIGQYADPRVRAKIYGVEFPIADLGGCKSYYECRSFCEDPVNAPSCVNYGKSRGFYHEDKVDPTVNPGVLEAAKNALGCDSYESCSSFCSVPTNYDKCNSFAKTQGIVGGHVENPDQAAVIEKAKQVLGCDSGGSCIATCDKPENRQRCSEFAKEVGIKGGESKVGPGGCTSEQTCKAFCADPNNFNICNGFATTTGSQFRGPGGCSSSEACRTHCEQNPQACGSVGIGKDGVVAPYYNPQEMCNRTPNCAWNGNNCSCGIYGGPHASVEPGSSPQPGRDDPATICSKYAGCSWSGNSCNCSGYTYQTPAVNCPAGYEVGPGGYCISKTYSYPTPYTNVINYSYPTPYSGGWGDKEQQEAACKSGGGTCDFSNGYCNCKGYKYSYPTPYSYSYPTPYNYSYPTPYQYFTPYYYSYPTPHSYSYPTPGGSYSYPTPYTYFYPSPYVKPYSYPTPYYYPYPTPYNYSYPTPGGSYSYPTPYSYAYPTPGGGGWYSYPTPYNYSYPTPYSYQTPYGNYPYPTPYSYQTPYGNYSYPTPQQYSYPTPQQYSYPTPEAYSYPSPYSTPPYSYPTPSGVQGVSTNRGLLQMVLDWLGL